MLFQLKEQKSKLHFLRSGVRTLFFNATNIARNVVYIKNFSKKNTLSISRKTQLTSNVNFSIDRFKVKIIKSDDPLVSFAQKLRYENFFSQQKLKSKIRVDSDPFDEVCEHLVVIDTSKSKNYVVGTYRLFIKLQDDLSNKYYTETEFDISNLKKANYKILEAGRSCVHPDYRDGSIIRLLWKGIASYISEQNVDFIIGCASFNTKNVEEISHHLSYLQNFHLAPLEYRSYPLLSKATSWKHIKSSNINKFKVFKELPPLIKAYIRAGAWIGKGAVLDESFGSIDVCILLKVQNIRKKYMNMKV